MRIFSAAENAAGNVSWLIVVDTDCSTAANLFLLAAPERLAICKSNSAHLAGDSAAWRRVAPQAPTQLSIAIWLFPFAMSQTNATGFTVP